MTPLGIYPNELKLGSKRGIVIPIFIATLLKIAEIEATYVSIDECKKIRHMHTIEYYLDFLKNGNSAIFDNMDGP